MTELVCSALHVLQPLQAFEFIDDLGEFNRDLGCETHVAARLWTLTDEILAVRMASARLWLCCHCERRRVLRRARSRFQEVHQTWLPAPPRAGVSIGVFLGGGLSTDHQVESSAVIASA